MAAVQPEVEINLQEPWRVGVKSLLELLDFNEVLKDLKIIKRDKNANAASKDEAISIILSRIEDYSDVLGLKNVTKRVLSRYLEEVDTRLNFVALLNRCLLRWNLPQTFQVTDDVFGYLGQAFVAALNSLQTHQNTSQPSSIRYCMTDECSFRLTLPDTIEDLQPSVIRGAAIVPCLRSLRVVFSPNFNDDFSFFIRDLVDRVEVHISGNCTRNDTVGQFVLCLDYMEGKMVRRIKLRIEGLQSLANLNIVHP